MPLLLGNSIIPMDQRIAITLGHNTNFYKEFYDFHYKLVLKINLMDAPTIQDVGNICYFILFHYTYHHQIHCQSGI